MSAAATSIGVTPPTISIATDTVFPPSELSLSVSANTLSWAHGIATFLGSKRVRAVEEVMSLVSNDDFVVGDVRVDLGGEGNAARALSRSSSNLITISRGLEDVSGRRSPTSEDSASEIGRWRGFREKGSRAMTLDNKRDGRD